MAGDYHGIVERRQRTLTDDDIEAIVEAAKLGCTPCPNGLTPEDAVELRSLARMLMRAKNVIGTTVLYGIIAGLIFLFYLGASKLKGPGG